VDLFGFEQPPPRLKRPPAPSKGRCRLFFALFPDADARGKLLEFGSDLQSRHRLGGKLQLEDRLHLTLDHLGDFASIPHEFVKAASDAAGGLASQYSSLPVSLNRIVSFGRRRESLPLVLKDSKGANPELQNFRASLWSALAERHVPGEGRSSFTPHVTLMYSPQILAEEVVDAIEWQAQEFLLIHSFIRETRYEVLGRWALKT
jgi:2'-5' RNA ligase